MVGPVFALEAYNLSGIFLLVVSSLYCMDLLNISLHKNAISQQIRILFFQNACQRENIMFVAVKIS